jgi:hypothetical protein
VPPHVGKFEPQLASAYPPVPAPGSPQDRANSEPTTPEVDHYGGGRAPDALAEEVDPYAFLPAQRALVPAAASGEYAVRAADARRKVEPLLADGAQAPPVMGRQREVGQPPDAADADASPTRFEPQRGVRAARDSDRAEPLASRKRFRGDDDGVGRLGVSDSHAQAGRRADGLARIGGREVDRRAHRPLKGRSEEDRWRRSDGVERGRDAGHEAQYRETGARCPQDRYCECRRGRDCRCDDRFDRAPREDRHGEWDRWARYGREPHERDDGEPDLSERHGRQDASSYRDDEHREHHRRGDVDVRPVDWGMDDDYRRARSPREGLRDSAARRNRQRDSGDQRGRDVSKRDERACSQEGHHLRAGLPAARPAPLAPNPAGHRPAPGERTGFERGVAGGVDRAVPPIDGERVDRRGPERFLATVSAPADGAPVAARQHELFPPAVAVAPRSPPSRNAAGAQQAPVVPAQPLPAGGSEGGDDDDDSDSDDSDSSCVGAEDGYIPKNINGGGELGSKALRRFPKEYRTSAARVALVRSEVRRNTPNGEELRMDLQHRCVRPPARARTGCARCVVCSTVSILTCAAPC